MFEENEIILISIAEHNSNLLPYLKANSTGAKIKLLGIKDGLIDTEEIKQSLTNKTKLVAVAHCSNVLGNINEVKEIGEIIKDFNKNIIYIVDGAQAVGHIPVDVKAMQADFYAFSGHKMYGPDGVGILYVSEKIQHLIKPVRPGGGTVKDITITNKQEEWTITPDYYNSLAILEGGTSNTSNIIGLSKAIEFIKSTGWETIRKHEIELTKKIIEGLSLMEDIEIYGPKDFEKKIGLVSFSTKHFHVKELANHLNERGICVRYGSHCAFILSENLSNETLRISLGVYNTPEDVDFILEEIKFFLDKKKGLIKNPNLELLKNKPYTKHTHIISSKSDIVKIINDAAQAPDTEVVVMGGHFIGIPDIKNNRFYPSIENILPDELTNLMNEFGMTSFPLYTLDVAIEIVKELKKKNIRTKLMIIANDTTGVNELRLSPTNKEGKSAEQYRDEMLSTFEQNKGLPDVYIEKLALNGLSLEDVVTCGDKYYFRETIARTNFKKFISNNRDYFDGMINYFSDDESIDIEIKILENQQIKTCIIDTFHSKTGGKFCIVEMCQFMAELFGKTDKINYGYLNEKVISPKFNGKNKIMVMLTPAMCNSAVNSGAELYLKLFFEGTDEKKFKFFNVPLGPNAEDNIKSGIELVEITS